MKKAERRELAYRRAFEYARTGEYRDWHHIEWILCDQGLLEARSVLDNATTRRELDEACGIARQAKARGITFQQSLEELAQPAKQRAVDDKPEGSPGSH
jgi:hypothetical protein